MTNDEHSERRRPTRGGPTLADLTLIVRTPGRPAGVRAFTDSEEPEAVRYAEQNSATVERLGGS